MKYSLIILSFLLTGCATKALYENGNRRQDIHVRILAQGPQPIEIYNGCYCVRDKDNIYQLMDYDRFSNSPNLIIIWVQDDLSVPNRYQLMNGDEYIMSGEIVRFKQIGVLDRAITIEGKVATFKAVEIKPIPLDVKLVLTPFTLAADISTLPLSILASPQAFSEAMNIGVHALSGK